MDNENTSLQEFQTQICLDAATSKVNNTTAHILYLSIMRVSKKSEIST